MGILDTLNLFKKKDEFSFAPLDGPNPLDTGHHDFEQNPLPQGQHPIIHEQGFHSPSSPSPLDDHRMSMPLGENIRQARIAAMHGEGEYQEQHGVQNPLQKDLELISSKLDYLKASLDAVNQRLINLEHLARKDNEAKRW